jgi:hypothetical protein
MTMDIERNVSNSPNIAVSNTVADATLVPLGTFAGGILCCVSTSTGAAITVSFHVRFAHNSAEFKLSDSSNNFITRSIQPNRCYAIPDELFAAPMFRVVADTAGQTAVLAVAFKG